MIRITQPEAPDEADLEQLAAGLMAYNQTYIGVNNPQKVASFVKSENESGQETVVGGIYGIINWGWLYIDWLWCHESIREQGVGRQLVTKIEDHAREVNITQVMLQTTDFQALGFYKKCGYEVYAQLNNFPVGYITYYLQKKLS